MIEKLTFTETYKERKNFYASDFLKSNLDLYFSWINEPKTNPTQWYDTLRWGAGRGVEEQMLIVLKMSGLVAEDYDQKLHGGFKVQREGITVSGYTDARMVEAYNGEPIEIKSINNKNANDVSSYKNGYPRKNYVGQLAIYMDVMQKQRGHLFVSSIDGLNRFWLYCNKIGDGIYQCGHVIVNVNEEYRRWDMLLKNNIIPKIMPDVFEHRYKIPVEEIDWHTISKSKISWARNGHGVIGDWEVLYSPWKDKIIELQGTVLGYTNKELAIIQEKTKGYTTWK